MSDWVVIHRDTDKVIESRDTGQRDPDGRQIVENRTTWTNEAAPEVRLSALTEAVDTLILDTLGGS